MGLDFKEDLKIDIHSLHTEWEKQAAKYMWYLEEQAVAEIERDRLKDYWEVEKAEFEKKIRANPEDYFEGKVTESAIRAEVLTNEGIKQTYNEYLEACKDAKLYGAVAKAMDHRKKGLEKLVDLHLAGYYSSPNINEAVVQDSAKEMKADQTKKLKAKGLKKRGRS